MQQQNTLFIKTYQLNLYFFYSKASKDGACDFRELLRHKEYAKQKQEFDKDGNELKHFDGPFYNFFCFKSLCVCSFCLKIKNFA